MHKWKALRVVVAVLLAGYCLTPSFAYGEGPSSATLEENASSDEIQSPSEPSGPVEGSGDEGEDLPPSDGQVGQEGLGDGRPAGEEDPLPEIDEPAQEAVASPVDTEADGFPSDDPSREDVGSPVLLADGAAVNDGLYVIASSLDESLVYDIASSDPSNGVRGCLWSENGQSNQTFSFQRQDDGTYVIRAYHSDKILAVSGIRARNGAAVVQWEDNGTPNMRWTLQRVRDGAFLIISADTGLCLDVAANSATKGADFVIWEPTGSSKQAFSLVPSQKTEGAGKTLEEGIYSWALPDDRSLLVGSSLSGASAVNGAGLETQDAQRVLSQKYSIVYHATDGCYTITNLGSGKALAVSGIQAGNGASVVLWDDNGTANMRWSIERAPGGYRVVSKDTSLCFDFAANDIASGAPCVVWESTGSSKQTFALESTPLVEDGYYAISPVGSPSLRVDVSGSSTQAGAPAILWMVNGVFSQKYHFVRNEDGTYAVNTLHSGQQLGVSPEGAIVQMPSGTSSSQRWTVSPDGRGGLRLEAVVDDGSLRAFSTAGNEASSAAVWGQQADAGNSGQSFSLVAVDLLEDGLYTISTSDNPKLILSQRNASSSNGASLALARDGGLPWSKYFVTNVSNDVVSIATSNGKVLAVDASGGNGSPIVQWDDNATDNMRWKLIPDYNGSVFITNVQTGMNVDYASNSAQAGDDIVVWNAHFGSKQRWAFSRTQASTEAYAYYNLSISEMLAYQMANPYITSSWQEVFSYLDPAQLTLKDGGYYTFASLRGYSGLTAAQLDEYIESTQLGRSGNLKGMGASFVDAAKRYDLNEMYLLSHAILESAWGTSTLALGYEYDGLVPVGGEAYPAGTYYNFYGIGAYDDSPLSGGRSMAIQNGWDSPQAAIEGAARWICFNYTNRVDYPQSTLYDMRWDPARSEDTGSRSWHQYATSITWASSIGRIMQLGYQYCGAAPDLTFIIPSYREA